MWLSNDTSGLAHSTPAVLSVGPSEDVSGGSTSGAYACSQPAPDARTIPRSPERHVSPSPFVEKTSTSASHPSAYTGKFQDGAANRQFARYSAGRSDAASRHTPYPCTQNPCSLTHFPPHVSALHKPSNLPAAFRRATSRKTAGGINPESSSSCSPSPVLLRHTYQGTTNVLYADGHVETFTAARGNTVSSTVATGKAGLPAIPHATSSSSILNKGGKQWKMRFGEGAVGAAAPAVAAAAAANFSRGSSASSSQGSNTPSCKPTLPAILDVQKNNSTTRCGSAFGALKSFEAAVPVFGAPQYNNHGWSFSKSPEESRTGVFDTTISGNTSTSMLFRDTLTPSRAHTEVTKAYSTTAATAPQSSVNRVGSSSFTASATKRAATYVTKASSDALQTAAASRDSAHPAELGFSQSLQQSQTQKSPDLKADKSHGEDDGTFFLTSVGESTQTMFADETARASFPTPATLDMPVLLAQMQHQLRDEFASDQRTRAEAYTCRFERSVQDSPSLFSLQFPFRPLEEIHRESAQLSAASFMQADGPRSPPHSLRGGVNAASRQQPATVRVPDILLSSAQVTTPMGWTIPELIQERLLPRETRALQHRFRELLTLRGVFDAPDTMTCRFCVAFIWFVLLRCRKSQREQTLVDGHRRLSKAFADAFPLSSRDTLPTLDVLGQLLVELFTCVRYEEERTQRRLHQQHDRVHKQRASTVSSSAAAQPVLDGAGARSITSRGGTIHRDGPHYANLSDLLCYTNFFPLLTGEWSFLLQHAYTTSSSANTTSATSTSPSSASLSQHTHQPLMELSNSEQADKKLSILPSSKALQTLLTINQELWLVHTKYVEICLYEEQLYKQLAFLCRNSSVQIAYATAGPSTAENTTSLMTSTISLKQRKGTAPSVLGASTPGVEESGQLSSYISADPAHFTTSGSLAMASTASLAAKDSILDSLLVAVAHITYFTCVFCFPNDVYASVFNDEFRIDVTQWLSYCCQGVVTTHVQTKHWPVPLQADYDAAQELRHAAEDRELAALGLHRSLATPKEQNTPTSLFASAGKLSSTEGAVSVGRRSRRESVSRLLGSTTEAEQKIRSASPLSTLPVPFAASGNTPKRARNGGNTSNALEALRDESLDLENVEANAEFRLAHQLDRYSRAAAQHVSELERRMARLQRRHKLAGLNGGTHGGSQRRVRRGSHVSRRGSFYGGLSRTNPGNIRFDLEDDDALGTSMHSINSIPSRLASFRKPTIHPSTNSAKAGFSPGKEAKSSSTKASSSSTGKKAAPSSPPLSAVIALLPVVMTDVDASACPSPLSASNGTAAQNPDNKKFANICWGIGNNNGDSNSAAWRSTNAELRTPATPYSPADLPNSHRRQSTSSKVNSVSRGMSSTGVVNFGGVGDGTGGAGGGGCTQPRAADPRDLYRTSASVKNDISLVALAAELNRSAVSNTASNDIGKPRPEGAHEAKKAGEGPVSPSRNATGARNARNKTSAVDVVGNNTDPQVSRLSSTASPSAASLLSCYPLCTCPVAITEYWLAMSLRVSSWWFPSIATSSRNVKLSLYSSPAAAALREEDLVNDSRIGSADSARGHEQQQQQALPPPLDVLAHEPWRGIFGRVVAVPPISSAAQRAVKLIDTLAESLPYQQSLVYQALRAQEQKHEQRRVEAALGVLHYSTNDLAGSSLQPSQQPLWNGLADTPNASTAQPITGLLSSLVPQRVIINAGVAETAAAAAAAALQQPNLGTATLPLVLPFTSGLDALSIASPSSTAQSAAARLRRRAIGETYEGCTSPFFQLYVSTCLALTLSSEEVSLLRESLNTTRDKRREEAFLSGGRRTDSSRYHSSRKANNTAGVLVLSHSSRMRVPTQDLHRQQVLSSVLPLSAPIPSEGPDLPYVRDRQATASTHGIPTTARPTSARKIVSAHHTHMPLRGARIPGASINAFAITTIPREEAKLRPCRMRPLQEEALRRRRQLLADMETIDKRDSVARQNYVVQQLHLANAIAHLQTDMMLRRYRVRGRLALERLEVEDVEGGNGNVHEVDERRDEEVFTLR